MTRLIAPPGGGPQTPGERDIVALLVRELPTDEYVVLPNVLILDRGTQRLEYDVIVVAPHGVYALEVKDWSGPISGDEREWNVRGRWGPSPIGGIEHKAKVLKSMLTTAKPALGRMRVEAVVVLAYPPDKLDLTAGARRAVRLRSEIVRFVTDPAAIGRPPGDIRTFDSVIVAEIAGRRAVDPGPLRFGPYEVRETLDESASESWHLAHRPAMPALPDVLLRVVPDSPYLNTPEQRQAARASMYREMEAAMTAGPHPNVVAVRDVIELDGAIVAVLDASEGMSLRRRLAIAPPLTLDQREAILLGTLRGLEHLHASGVVHRALSPETILLDGHSNPKLTRFGLAKLAGPGAPTVWRESGVDDSPYRAPELAAAPHDATGAADVYSAGVIARELYAGSATSAHEGPLPDSTPQSLAELIPRMLAADPSRRPSAVDAIASLAPGDQPAPAEPGPKTQYEPGDIIDGFYEVRSLLGTGGFSSVYRVYYAIEDRDFALKVFNSAGSFEALQRELTILRELRHPHVVEVIWGSRTSAGQWYLVSKYVEGEPLDKYAYGPKSLSPREAVEVIDQLLDALAAIHPDEERARELVALEREAGLTEEQYEELLAARQGVIHRDVKPGNLILTPQGIVLIDFNIASIAGSRVATVAGTPRYRPPEADYTVWNVYTDLFATGVVAYELLCHKHPYEHLAPGDDWVPADPRVYRPDLTPELAAWLVRACAGSRAEHFSSAKEMRAALRGVGSPTVDAPAPPEPEPAVDAPPNTNPYVAMFLEMASQARRSNTGTRGLTQIARRTYVATRLDGALAAAISGGEHRLAVVTGNAGDGKTAFIQMLEETLVAAGAARVASHANGSELRHAGRSLVTLYDGSQDESDETSDEVLGRFFGRVLSNGAGAKTTGLVAVNEGRLRDFALGHAGKHPELMALVGELDEPGSLSDPTLALVNLNLRSVTSGGADSILSRQFREVVQGPFWAACAGCDWRHTCPIKHNVDTLADRTSGELVIERLRALVDIVRLRRRRHLTLRDLRSLISFVLFRDRTCEEIGALASRTGGAGWDLLDLLYFQAIGGLGAPEGSAIDRAASLLGEIDVAGVANPALDRLLQIESGPRRASFEARESDLGASLIAGARASLPQGFAADAEPHRRVHEAHRRLTFFERGDDGWPEMLPYKRLHQFRMAMTDPVARASLKRDLLSAISASEGALPIGNETDDLRLANGAGGGVRAFRQFPGGDFDLLVPPSAARYVESEPDALELVHLPSGTLLSVDLDLLEVLEHLRRGHIASAEERRGFMLSLTLFRNRLLMEPSRTLVLEHDGETFILGPDGASGVRLEAAGA